MSFNVRAKSLSWYNRYLTWLFCSCNAIISTAKNEPCTVFKRHRYTHKKLLYWFYGEFFAAWFMVVFLFTIFGNKLIKKRYSANISNSLVFFPRRNELINIDKRTNGIQTKEKKCKFFSFHFEWTRTKKKCLNKINRRKRKSLESGKTIKIVYFRNCDNNNDNFNSNNKVTWRCNRCARRGKGIISRSTF